MSDESFQGLPTDVATKMAALPGISNVSAMRFGRFQINGDGKPFGAVDPAAFGKLIDVKVTGGRIEDLANGGVMVQADPVRDLGLKIGDTVTATWQNGTTTPLPVVGTFKDASVLGTNWIVALDTMAKASPAADPRDQLVAANLKQGTDPVATRAELDSLLGDYPQLRVEDRAEYRKRQLGQINQLLTIINGMLLLAVVIALLGIANTLALSVFERTRELGLLRAVGMSRRQLRRAVRWEAVIVALFGALLGIVIGTPLGAAISSAMPKSFVSTVTVPVGQLVVLLVVALLAGMVAAIFPARRAGRMNVLAAIASE